MNFTSFGGFLPSSLYERPSSKDRFGDDITALVKAFKEGYNQPREVKLRRLGTDIIVIFERHLPCTDQNQWVERTCIWFCGLITKRSMMVSSAQDAGYLHLQALVTLLEIISLFYEGVMDRAVPKGSPIEEKMAQAIASVNKDIVFLTPRMARNIAQPADGSHLVTLTANLSLLHNKIEKDKP